MPNVSGYPRNSMFSLGWLIGVGIVAGLAGAGFGVWYNQRSGASKRVIELEEQLSSSQQAHEEYRQEVFDQFSDTAAKFQTLNESYVDLHEQLAKSANVLCGDMEAGSLLEGSLVSALADESDEDAVSDVVDDRQSPDAEDEIIVAEAPSLDEIIGPLEEDDASAPPDVFAPETATAAPEADDDAKVREVG